jgi:Na+-transporting methylmalonyl-CoA/oxaloacetate decarboxylase beta subunit
MNIAVGRKENMKSSNQKLVIVSVVAGFLSLLQTAALIFKIPFIRSVGIISSADGPTMAVVSSQTFTIQWLLLGISIFMTFSPLVYMFVKSKRR